MDLFCRLMLASTHTITVLVFCSLRMYSFRLPLFLYPSSYQYYPPFLILISPFRSFCLLCTLCYSIPFCTYFFFASFFLSGLLLYYILFSMYIYYYTPLLHAYTEIHSQYTNKMASPFTRPYSQLKFANYMKSKFLLYWMGCLHAKAHYFFIQYEAY